MGKYSTNTRQAPPPRRNSIHGVMRGIGCLLFVIVPIMAFEVAKLVANGPARAWAFIPREWFQRPELHPLLARLDGIRSAWAFLSDSIPFTTANLIFTFVITIVIYGVLSVIYGYLFAMIAPSRYGPTDVPPPRVKTKKYTR